MLVHRGIKHIGSRVSCRYASTNTGKSSNSGKDEMIRFRSHVLPSDRANLARYGGRQTVTALPGDGIGPEMIDHVNRIFSFAQVPVDFETIQVSSDNPREEDLENAIVSIKRNGVALKVVIFILYGLEHESAAGVVESLKIVTREKMERISRYAFDYAMKYDRKKVTAVHKANIQKLGDGLFLKIASDIAKNEYPEIKFSAMIVDNASMQLVSRPQQFSGGIMLMPNLYGNIISNIACGLVGGPGLVSGMNFGNKYAVFETATRNTGTTLAGKDIANPTAFIRASCDMLRYLNFNEYADLISDALFETLTIQRIHTQDIGGTAKASELVNSLLENIEKSCVNTKYRFRS
uniref:Isopropylmalate dehydrogenase-like domain-containing protein n=1 Tax=Panagrolaimus sp. ES5 TaxID=591445 RepID=A0AC34F8A7_9BILA